MATFLKSLLTILVIAIIGLAGYDAFRAEPGSVPVEAVAINAPQGEPTFSWKYATDESGEISQTTISVIALYPDRSAVTKEVDTIEGSCNSYDTPDADVYLRSHMIICYYAGLGHYYKIVEKNGAYAVQRKVFEEASPDYNPPIQPFETVAEF